MTPHNQFMFEKWFVDVESPRNPNFSANQASSCCVRSTRQINIWLASGRCQLSYWPVWFIAFCIYCQYCCSLSRNEQKATERKKQIVKFQRGEKKRAFIMMNCSVFGGKNIRTCCWNNSSFWNHERKKILATKTLNALIKIKSMRLNFYHVCSTRLGNCSLALYIFCAILLACVFNGLCKNIKN